MSKKILALLLALVMVFALAACSSSKDDDGTGGTAGTTGGDSVAQQISQGTTTDEVLDASQWSYDTTLNIAMNGEPDCLVYEYSGMTKPNFIAVRMMHSALWEYDQNGELVPSLAEEWEWVDSLHIRVKIHEGVTAYDGSELTADDILWCLEQGEAGSAFGNFAPYYNASESYVEDTYTIVIGLAKVNSNIFRQFSEFYIVSKSCVESLGGLQAAAMNPKCNVGRYNFVEWVPGQYILLERNENYWGKDREDAGAYYQYVKLTWITDSASRVMALQAGDVDLVTGLGYSDCTAFLDSTDLTVIARDTARVAGLTFNCAEGHLFTDKNLRCALYELIDPEVCALLMYGGYPETTETMCSTKASWYVPNLDPDRAVDMEAAKQYLAAAGCPDGFEFTLLLEPDDAMRSVAEYLQSVFLEVGIKMNITNVEYGDFFQRLNDGDYDVQMTQSGHFIDPGPGAQTYDGRLSYVETDGGANVYDQTIFDLCDTIYSTVDEEELQAACTELTNIVFENHYTIGMCNTVNFAMSRNDITGFVVGQNGIDHVHFMRPVEG